MGEIHVKRRPAGSESHRPPLSVLGIYRDGADYDADVDRFLMELPLLGANSYPGADRLDFRRHDHKAGVTPFLQAVGKVLAVVEFARPRIRMSWPGNKPRMDVYFSAVALGLSADPDETVYSDDPFDFVARSGAHGEEGEVVTFAEELADIASRQGTSEIFELIRKEANLRNVLLYAQESGIPKAEFDRALLLHRMMRVCVILQVTIAILQTSTLQTFVIQCVEAYLAALKKVSDQGYNFAGEEQLGDQLRYIVKKLDGGPAVAEVEMTREVRLDSITLTADTVGFNMTGLNDGRAYGVEFRERSSQDPEN